MRIFHFLFLSILFTLPVQATYELDAATKEKILAQGVPAASLERILDWMNGKYGTNFTQRVYSCKKQAPANLKPCAKEDRVYSFKEVSIEPHRYAVSIDYALPSTEKRFYFIDLLTGAVEKSLVSHGKGSGELIAKDFSNIPDSKKTSLGIYKVGEKYFGNHGGTLRMYGLEATNDTAYERDIVFHGADYAHEKFIKKTNPRTGLPYGRLGVSEGCPAITYALMERYLPLLENGGVIDHYHSEFIR